MRSLIEKKRMGSSIKGWHSKLDWNGWKLYEPDNDSERTKVEKAADALNAAMLKFRKALSKGLRGISEYDTEVVGPIAGKLYDSVLIPVHEKFRASGANDTPVREVSTVAAIKMVKDIYGKKGWTKLGDYIG